MNTRIKRPPSVWLTQTLLIIFALLWVGILVLNLVRLVGTDSEGQSILRVAMGFSVSLFFVLLLLGAFLGLAKERFMASGLGSFHWS